MYGYHITYRHERVIRLPQWLVDNEDYPVKVGDVVHRFEPYVVRWFNPKTKKLINLRLGQSYSRATGEESELNK